MIKLEGEHFQKNIFDGNDYLKYIRHGGILWKILVNKFRVITDHSPAI